MTVISADDPHPRHRVSVKGSEMSHAEIGEGVPVVFLHGNPTSSYLWRNVMPPVAAAGYRCLAPDLIGMGDSDKLPDGTLYTYFEHYDYLSGWFDAVLPDGKVALVVHDWGGPLGFEWARRHPDRVAAIAFMETIVMPGTWDGWPDRARGIFQGMRSDKGEELVLERNDADPGSILNGEKRATARRLPNVEVVTVKGLHFIQEDSPAEIGGAVADFLTENNV